MIDWWWNSFIWWVQPKCVLSELLDLQKPFEKGYRSCLSTWGYLLPAKSQVFVIGSLGKRQGQTDLPAELEPTNGSMIGDISVIFPGTFNFKGMLWTKQWIKQKQQQNNNVPKEGFRVCIYIICWSPLYSVRSMFLLGEFYGSLILSLRAWLNNDDNPPTFMMLWGGTLFCFFSLRSLCHVFGWGIHTYLLEKVRVIGQQEVPLRQAFQSEFWQWRYRSNWETCKMTDFP